MRSEEQEVLNLTVTFESSQGALASPPALWSSPEVAWRARPEGGPGTRLPSRSRAAPGHVGLEGAGTELRGDPRA